MIKENYITEFDKDGKAKKGDKITWKEPVDWGEKDKKLEVEMKPSVFDPEHKEFPRGKFGTPFGIMSHREDFIKNNNL